MKVKLTKEEFIKRSMSGEVFKLNDCKYFYDAELDIPFRCDNSYLHGDWRYFNGINEFTVVEPKSKTKIVKEWIYNIPEDKNQWLTIDKLMTDNEAKEHFGELKYKPTGREFEVPEE